MNTSSLQHNNFAENRWEKLKQMISKPQFFDKLQRLLGLDARVEFVVAIGVGVAVGVGGVGWSWR